MPLFIPGMFHARDDKTVPVGPLRVIGIEGHKLVEEHMSSRGYSHRGSRVARVRLEGGIDSEGADRVDRKLVNIREVHLERGLSEIEAMRVAPVLLGRNESNKRNCKLLSLISRI